MFAIFIAQSKFVTAVCVALSVAAFFVVKPWYYGLLAAIGVFIGTAVVRVPFKVVSNKASDKRIDETTKRWEKDQYQ
jgi:hypothetical protein